MRNYLEVNDVHETIAQHEVVEHFATLRVLHLLDGVGEQVVQELEGVIAGGLDKNDAVGCPGITP